MADVTSFDILTSDIRRNTIFTAVVGVVSLFIAGGLLAITETNKGTQTSPALPKLTELTGTFTGDLIGNATTASKIASINNNNIVQLDSTQTLTNKTLTSPIITGNGAIAGVFTGPLVGPVTGNVTGDVTGNASTATKITSIDNNNIVQLDTTQTLTNKTLTSPTITGNGAIAGVFTGPLVGPVTGDLVGNVNGNLVTNGGVSITSNLLGYSLTNTSVTQTGTRDSTVTLNSRGGEITLVDGFILPREAQEFTLLNNTITANSVVVTDIGADIATSPNSDQRKFYTSQVIKTDIGMVTAAQLQTAGTGYQVNDEGFLFSDSSGKGARFKVTTVGGGGDISVFEVTGPGFGYTSNETVSLIVDNNTQTTVATAQITSISPGCIITIGNTNTTTNLPNGYTGQTITITFDSTVNNINRYILTRTVTTDDYSIFVPGNRINISGTGGYNETVVVRTSENGQLTIQSTSTVTQITVATGGMTVQTVDAPIVKFMVLEAF